MRHTVGIVGIVLVALMVSALLALRSSALQRRLVFFPEVLGEDAVLRFSRPRADLFFDSPTSRRHNTHFVLDDARPGAI